ncbi:MAG: hypothetical protein WA790_07550 [Sulfitobacter sp.]
MREVFLSDLTAVARVLLRVPAPQRNALCKQMLIEADWADKFTRRFNKAHKIWGNGTLSGVAQSRQLGPEKSFSDAEYRSCIMSVLHCLEHHRARKACKSGLHTHMKYELHHGFAFG